MKKRVLTLFLLAITSALFVSSILLSNKTVLARLGDSSCYQNGKVKSGWWALIRQDNRVDCLNNSSFYENSYVRGSCDYRDPGTLDSHGQYRYRSTTRKYKYCVHNPNEVLNCYFYCFNHDICGVGECLQTNTGAQCVNKNCKLDYDCECDADAPVDAAINENVCKSLAWTIIFQGENAALTTEAAYNFYVDGQYIGQQTTNRYTGARSSVGGCYQNLGYITHPAYQYFDCNICNTPDWVNHILCRRSVEIPLPNRFKDSKMHKHVIKHAATGKAYIPLYFNCPPDCDDEATLSSSAHCGEVTLTASHKTKFVNVTNTVTSSVGSCSWNGDGTSAKCKAITDEPFDWTHTWSNCITVGDATSCSKRCTKTLRNQSNGYVEPNKCSNLSYLVSPNPIVIGEPAKVVISGYKPEKTYLNESLFSVPPNVVNCTYSIAESIVTNKIYNCSVVNENYDKVRFAHTWTEHPKDCPQLKINCSNGTDDTKIESKDPVILTERGNVQIGNSTANTGIFIQRDCDIPFSSYIFGAEKINNIKFGNSISCSNPSLCSLKNSILANYRDNNRAPNKNWFNYLKNRVGAVATNIKRVNLPVNGNLDVNGYDDNSIIIIDSPNNVTINANQTCNKNNIFFINGDLTIHPSIFGSGNLNGACMFVVNGKTTVTQGGSNQTEYINAFIVTNGILMEADIDPIIVNGGIISSNDTILKRNIKTPQCLPSTLIRYDGVRYIHNLSKLTQDPKSLSIKEIFK